MSISYLLYQVPPPPEKPIPRIRFLINGRPQVLTAALPKIRIPRRVPQGADNSVSENFDLEAPISGSADNVEDNANDDDDRSDSGTYWHDRAEDDGIPDNEEFEDNGWEWDDDEVVDDIDDLRQQVDQLAAEIEDLEQEDTDSDQEESDHPGPTINRATYLFCPLAHRVSVMRLFAKHTSQ